VLEDRFRKWVINDLGHPLEKPLVAGVSGTTTGPGTPGGATWSGRR
jgi:hypothetical protein